MRKEYSAYSIVPLLILASGCGVFKGTSAQVFTLSQEESAVHPAVTEKMRSPSPDMAFLAVDVSRTLEPFQHVQGLRDAGITFFGVEKLFWDDFEAKAASGFDWKDYDAVIREVESIGGDVLPTIWSVSTWATVVPSAGNPASAPKAEYRERYAGFIQAFMERYDHDGLEDMPGLLYAHPFLQIEDEAENLTDAWAAGPVCGSHEKNSEEYFRCAADEYGEMLQRAYQAAHAANPDARVLSFSFNFGDFFDANPAAFPAVPSFARHRLDFLDQVFTGYHDYFDLIALQCNYDYPGIPRAFDYIRDTYRLGKAILCADAASMPMIGQQQGEPGDRYIEKYPFLADRGILEILDGGPSDGKYAEIRSWWEAEKSKLSVKKAVVAADAGAVQIGFQFVMTGWGGKNNIWSHSDLLSAGPEFGDEEPAGTPRPVVYALGQLGKRIVDFHSIENMNPIPPGTDPRSWVWIYRFPGREGFVFVVWSGSEERTVDFTEYVSAPTVSVARIPTTLDGNNRPVYPQEETLPADSILVNETPMFVE